MRTPSVLLPWGARGIIYLCVHRRLCSAMTMLYAFTFLLATISVLQTSLIVRYDIIEKRCRDEGLSCLQLNSRERKELAKLSGSDQAKLCCDGLRCDAKDNGSSYECVKDVSPRAKQLHCIEAPSLCACLEPLSVYPNCTSCCNVYSCLPGGLFGFCQSK